MICPHCETELQTYSSIKGYKAKNDRRRYCPSCKLAYLTKEYIVKDTEFSPVRSPVSAKRYNSRALEKRQAMESDPPAVVRYKEAMSTMRGVRYKINV